MKSVAELNPALIDKAARAPTVPGCYLWKNPEGEILYIGKAINIRKRVQSYLRDTLQDRKTWMLQQHLYDLDWIVTETEVEALLLEDNLIKKNQPPWNIRLKDDKKYPFLVLTIGEDFPRLFISRNSKLRGVKYFGPFTDVRTLRSTLDIIHKIFPIRKKRQPLPGPKFTEPCLNYHIGRCLAPCAGKVDKTEYKKMIDQVVLFIEGQHQQLASQLHQQMMESSALMQFEKAARIRDQLTGLNNLSKRQAVYGDVEGTFDTIGMAWTQNQFEVSLLEFREGKLQSKKSWELDSLMIEFDSDLSLDVESPATNSPETTDSKDGQPTKIQQDSNQEVQTNVRSLPGEFYNEICSTILRQLYLTQNEIRTSVIYFPARFKEIELFTKVIAKKFACNVVLQAPNHGPRADTIKLATKNASLELIERQAARHFRNRHAGLQEIQTMLGLNNIPQVIECYDISHFQGSLPVASGVQFKDGKPFKSEYRRYIMKGFAPGQIHDPGMIQEVVSRRLQYLLNQNRKLPDLFVIDGGQTQLAAAVEVFQTLEIKHTAIVSLAKRKEEIYFPGNPKPVQFDPNSRGMRLLRQLRNEAHRFAVTFHRLRRMKKSFATDLEKVPGLAGNKLKNLLEFLSQHENINTITEKDLQAMAGIGPKLAHNIIVKLKKQSNDIAK